MASADPAVAPAPPPGAPCRLLGEAHAGAGGNRRAQVTALELHPSRLQIDDVAGTGRALAAAAALSPGPKTAYLGGRDASLQVAAGLLDAGDGWLSEESSSRWGGRAGGRAGGRQRSGRRQTRPRG